jgi:hypothetical protein
LTPGGDGAGVTPMSAMSPAQIKTIVEQPYAVRALLLRLHRPQVRFVKIALADLPIEERGAVLESVAARLPSGGRVSDVRLVGALRAVLGRRRTAA